MQYRLLDVTEKDRFDNFIKHHSKGHILQTWEWGEVKEGAWQPLRLIIEENGEIIAACSLLKRPLPLAMGSLFYAPRGPVLDISRMEVWDYLWKAVAEVAKVNKAIFCKVDPDVAESNRDWQMALSRTGFIAAGSGPGFEGIQPRHVFRLDISPCEEELLAAMHQKTRYNLRLAEKKGVKVDIATSEELGAFYALLQETAERDRFLIRPLSYFQSFYEHLQPKGLAEMFLVRYQDKNIAGALAFKLGKKAWYIYGASSNQYRNVMPNYLMQWEMIKWAKANGCTLYDFRGVPGDVPDDHPLYGLVKFKRGFGGQYTSFVGEFDLPFRKGMYSFYNFIEPKYQVGVRKIIYLKKKLRKK